MLPLMPNFINGGLSILYCRSEVISSVDIIHIVVFFFSGVGVFNLDRDEQSPWAAKIVSRHTGRDRKQYSNRLCLEAKVLSSLNHPNIIGYRAFVKRPDGREVCFILYL